MKRLIFLFTFIVLCFVTQNTYGWWTSLYNRGTPLATYYLGDKLIYQFEFAVDQETSSMTVSYGLGTTTDGSGWTWRAAEWSRMDGTSNRVWKAKTNEHTFTSTGTWYYAGRFVWTSDSYTEYATADWSQNRTSITASSYFTVSALVNPTIGTLTSTTSSITIPIQQWNSKYVTILRNTSNSFTDPTQGTAYTEGNSIGGATVVAANSNTTSFTDYSLTPGTTYYYKVYSNNNNYYSPGTVVSKATELGPAISGVSSSPGTSTQTYKGATIKVTGTTLGSVTTVKLGGSAGTTISGATIGATQITFTVPDATSGGTVYVSDGTNSATSTTSFTNLGYITKAATDWNVASTWLGNETPSSGSKVTIDHDVTLNQNANVSSLTVNSGKTFTASDGTARILTIAAGGTLTNNGTFAPATGTVAFAGGGTISGSSPISLYNMSFASGSTISVANSVSSSQLFNMASGSAYTFSFTNNATFTTAGINSTGSNTLNLLNGGSSGSSKFITTSNLTISDGTSLSLGTSALPLQVNDNVSLSGTGSLTLGSNTGGDILLTGNWSRNAGTFTPNSRAVTFNGTGTQTMTNTNSGSLTFDYLAINNNGGSVKLGSDVAVSKTLQLFTGTLDLNQKTLTISNTSDLELGNGSGTTTESIISTGGAGTVSIPSGKTITVKKFNNGGTPSFNIGNNVILSASGPFNPGSTLTTFASGSTLQLNSGGSVSTNSPVYSAGSSLVYNLNNGSSSKINQGLEWPASSGPTNVTLLNNSWVQLNANTSLTGNLTVTKGALQATGGKTLTMSGTSQTITVSTASGGAIYGTDNGTGNDLTLAIASGSVTTFTGDATTNNDDEKKFYNITVNSGGTLALSRGILCKYGTFTVDGTLQINENGYVQATNGKPATYGTAGSLVYNNGGSYSTTDLEWPGTNSPVNVTVQNTGTAVLLTGNRTISGNLTISAGSFTIGSTKSLTVTGTLTNNAGNTGLVIKSDATGTGSLIHSSDNVPATIERYVTGSSVLTQMKYHQVSIPASITSPTSNLFLGSYLYRFDETATSAATAWIGLGGSTTTPLDINKGYMIYYPNTEKTYSFAGNLRNGTVSPPLTYTSGGQAGYNLVPNPYPSAIDWKATTGWTKTNLTDAIYIWNSASSTANYGSYIGTTSTNGVTNIIPAGQAFFVKANAASPALSMNNSVRLHDAKSFMKSSSAVNPYELHLFAASGGVTDEIAIRFADDATSNFDSHADAYKLYGNADNPQLNSVTPDGTKLSINSLPFSTFDAVVPLEFRTGKAADVTFTASGLESFDALTPVMLEDKTEGRIIDLRQQPEYTFRYDPTNPAGRFQLRFANITGTSPGERLQGSVFTSGGKLNVSVPAMSGSEAAVSVYSITGQLLSTRHMVMNGAVQLAAPVAPGMYMVKITSGNKVYVEKFIINRNN